MLERIWPEARRVTAEMTDRLDPKDPRELKRLLDPDQWRRQSVNKCQQRSKRRIGYKKEGGKYRALISTTTNADAGTALRLGTWSTLCGFSTREEKMKPIKLMAATVAAMVFGSGAFAQANLTAETASPGGATYLSLAHLTEIAGTNGIASIQLADGQTLTNSIQNVAEGKTDIAGTPYILPFLMGRGVGPYGSLGVEKGAELAENLRVINPFTLGIFFLYAYDAKGIEGWDDLRGRKIYNGPPRGGALTNARNMIQIVAGLKDGEDYEGLQVNWGQGTTLVTSGEPDAVVLPELFPSGRLTAITAAGKMTGWSMPREAYESEAMQKYMQAPGSAPFTIDIASIQASMGEDWTFVSEDATFRAFATIGGNVVHRNMDEELVYNLVTAYIGTLDELKSKAPYGETVGFDFPMQGMCGANPVKYHPGAARAWQDAGFELDDCALAN